MGRLAHRFCSSGQYNGGLTQRDLLGCLSHSLKPRTAESIYRHRGGLDGRAGAKPDVAGKIDRVRGGLKHVAEHNMINRLGVYAAPLKCPLCGDNSKVCCGKVFQGAAE
jgi:hypothetical protein